MVADIFWCPGSCIGHRLAERTSYDGLRAIGDFLEYCHKLPAMVGDQLRLISAQSPTNDMRLRQVADPFPIIYKFRGFAGLESFYDYFLVRASALETLPGELPTYFNPAFF